MKKNSLSGRIAKTVFTVSILSSTVSFALFALLYMNFFDAWISAVFALCVEIAVFTAFGVFLSKKSAQEIAESMNFDKLGVAGENPTYVEFEPLQQKALKLKRENAEKIKEVTELYTKQDKMRRDFTANVSHELKTPLTSIRGYAELIREGITNNDDTVRFAGKIYDESQRLITLVGDIIKLSQLDGNDIEVKIEEIDLFELTKGVISHLEMLALENEVTVNLNGESAKIRGGEQIVEEIVFNIIDNAVKYNKRGGRVDVKVRQRIDGVELEVKDTGIGIAEDDIPHIFERFWRVDKSHSKDIGGTGLGLSIVKHGAMFMGASVSVSSKLSEGTTIRILF